MYVVSDNASTHSVLAELLRDAGFRVWTFQSARDFLDVALRAAPGCVLADVAMQDLNGLGLLSEVKKRGLNMAVVLVADQSNTAMTVAAVRAGASDFVERPFTPDTLCSAVRSALDEIEHHMQLRDVATEASRCLAQLTLREREVLQGLVAGKTNKDIAQDLTISVRTVEFYRSRTMRKMHARGFSELVRLALAAGLSFNAR